MNELSSVFNPLKISVMHHATHSKKNFAKTKKSLSFKPNFSSTITPFSLLSSRFSKHSKSKKIQFIKIVKKRNKPEKFSKMLPKIKRIESTNLDIKKISKFIAENHSFEKHAEEFGFSYVDEMTSHIERVIKKPTLTRHISYGRTAYWDDPTQSIVILNPQSSFKGTTFVPKKGIEYFMQRLH